jgi:4-carboxymuconolactone decarboxylase
MATEASAARLDLSAELNDEQRRILEQIFGEGARIPAPFLIWAKRPELCHWVENLGDYCRSRSAFPQALRELVVLICSRHLSCETAWNAHYKRAIELGISQESLDRLARREDPGFEGETQSFYQFVKEVNEVHFVSDATYAAALDAFGEDALIDLMGMIGSFSMSSMTFNTFGLIHRPGEPQPFADLH